MTLRPNIPIATAPVMEGPRFQRYWYQFIQNLYESLGWHPDRNVYDTVFLPAEALSLASTGTTSFTFSFRVPERCKNGSTATLFADFSATLTGDARIQVSAYKTSPGQTLPSPTVEAKTVSVSTANQLFREEMLSLTVSSGDLIHGTFSRLGSDSADTLSSTATLYGISLRYAVEGSGKEVTT